MFLRSSCSRNECEAPKSSEDSWRKRHKIAHFTSHGSFTGQAESNVSMSQDIGHQYCCHHHQDFSHAEENIFDSSGEISSMPMDAYVNNKISANNENKENSPGFNAMPSADTRTSRSVSSVSLNYSHSSSTETLPFPDITTAESVDGLDFSYPRTFSSTPIARQQNLRSGFAFWAIVDTFKRRNIHSPNLLVNKPSMKSRCFGHIRQFYDFVTYWLKLGWLNSKEVISNFKMFSGKEIIMLSLLLLLLCLICYIFQNGSLLQSIPFLHAIIIRTLSRTLSFLNFVSFHNNQNELPLTPNLQAMDPSTSIKQDKVEHVPFYMDVLKTRFEDDNKSETETLIAKYVARELEHSPTLTNWQNENFFMRKEVSNIKKEFADLKSEFKGLQESLKVVVDLVDKFGILGVNFSQQNSMLNENMKNVEENREKPNATNSGSCQIHLTKPAAMLLLKNLKSQNTTQQFADTPSVRFASMDALELISKVTKNAEALKTMEKQIGYLDTELRSNRALERKGYSVGNMENMIKAAISLYDADKTGETDYALESGGGKIMEHSKSYKETPPLFGFSFWGYKDCSPRLAIQPDTHPGHCWAMDGTQGFLVVQLAHTIWPTGFVIEHAPASIIPSGNLNSAPKTFSIYGISSGDNATGKLLGNYTYDIKGDPLQVFPMQLATAIPLDHIKLKIHTNYGNPSYTCLYRFRVHGVHHIEGAKE